MIAFVKKGDGISNVNATSHESEYKEVTKDEEVIEDKEQNISLTGEENGKISKRRKGKTIIISEIRA